MSDVLSAGAAGSKKPKTVCGEEPERALALLRELDMFVWDVIEKAAVSGVPPLTVVSRYVWLRASLKRCLLASESQNAALAPTADVPAQPQAPSKPSSTVPGPVAARQPARSVSESELLVARCLRTNPVVTGPEVARQLAEAGCPVGLPTARRLLRRARG
ncbi:hypothetical protein ADK47_06875 [Streptomyces rimosus subsp. rimosus]|uniref:Transposase n=1 Tax=Streptomyces rimosus subsp. rimosus TaxID=132474 RepID=A0ABY3ZGD7_STRRM|nr:hypothetical protein [Streptomyces rimosus]KOG82020.1 hypothetical protein ADK78_03220 [Kitasatospora aureofaciens]KOT66120.1 hypothetical protein ADK45_11030 [Streptomyces rimosus subsp. rimosus]KOT83734.1 hypothetical protein ADK47_06875 [Streptomyces rimosus subsp. rimosus]KOT86640.1 hypothetical protein ADK48_10290 [Streptomyces rimosus subsp. rimosus]QDA10403.1 hypothetical protein CTZ40_42435 [Streptomyces rimosus]